MQNSSRRRSLPLVAALIFLVFLPIAAQTAQSAVEGVYDLVVTEASMGSNRMTLYIERDGGALKARSEGDPDIAIKAVSVKGDTIVLTASYQDMATFDLPGTLTRDGGMSGKWSSEGGFGGSWAATKKQNAR